MVQESEDSSKFTFIHRHFFGAVGVLIGSAAKVFLGIDRSQNESRGYHGSLCVAIQD
ncbi:MAG: hypothetical protein ACI4C1_08795 [Lachnospiraceae bacterium]